MNSPLPSRNRLPRQYKITVQHYDPKVCQARVLAYLATHGPCTLPDFGRCAGLADAHVTELSEALSLLVVQKRVSMSFERVLIRNDEGRPSIGRIPMFALAAQKEGGGG